jgi:hypothetical protein
MCISPNKFIGGGKKGFRIRENHLTHITENPLDEKHKMLFIITVFSRLFLRLRTEKSRHRVRSWDQTYNVS